MCQPSYFLAAVDMTEPCAIVKSVLSMRLSGNEPAGVQAFAAHDNPNITGTEAAEPVSQRGNGRLKPGLQRF